MDGVAPMSNGAVGKKQPNFVKQKNITIDCKIKSSQMQATIAR